MAAGPLEALPGGPYVQAALFCEYTLREADNVISLIRVVDQITHREVGVNAPDEMPKFAYRLRAVVMLKQGNALGRHALTLRIERPNGLSQEIGTTTVNFTGGPHAGVNSVLDLNLEFELEGLYWFDILLDSRLLTRMPLQVNYQSIKQGSALGG